ncbi:MAG: hypothetical protein ABUL58_01375 [Steroidobacter sp.]
MNDQPAPPKPWLAQELIWLLGSLVGGLLVLPAMIYAVGTRMFGAYKGSGAGITAFYSDFAHDLATAHLASWALVLGPLVLVYGLRLTLGMLPIPTGWLQKLTRKNAAQ